MTGGVQDLAALSFNYTESADDVWQHSDYHVEGLHGASTRILLDGLAEAAGRGDASPIGVVIQGQRGTGKTHLLGWLREQAQRQGGYFVLVGLLDAKGFWESTMVSILDSLWRPRGDGQVQLAVFLERLASEVGLSRMARRAITGKRAVTREELDAFVTALRRLDAQVGRECQDTARAMVLLAGTDLGLQDLGEAFLSSAPEGEPGERALWGIRQVGRTPQEIVRNVSRLMALTGPTIIAVDQIDPLVAQSSTATTGAARDPGETAMIERIAGGLMALREVTRRTLTVVTCIPATWTLVEDVAVDTVRDRFRQSVQLMTLPDADTARTLVAKRFEVQYGEAGIKPPYPTWPVRPEAFEQAPGFTPRQLLIRIDRHVRACLLDDEVRELTGFAATPPADEPALTLAHEHALPPAADLGALDARFAELRDGGQAPRVDQVTEDRTMPALLAAGLSAWIAEQAEPGIAFSVDPPPSSKPPLHARLRRTLDEAREDEVHWAFRAVTAGHGNAALNRIRKASVAAGLDAEVPKRRLFLLRNAPWSTGTATQAAIAAFEQAGGRTLRWSDDDLRVLAALKALLAENPPHLTAWLAERRPTVAVSFLREALADAWSVPASALGPARTAGATTPGAVTPGAVTPGEISPGATPSGAVSPGAVSSGAVSPGAVSPGAVSPGETTARQTPPVSTTTPPPLPVSAVGSGETTAPQPAVVSAHHRGGPGPATRVPYLAIGRRMADGAPVSVALEALRKHVTIFAGTGSGKTVLIRRLVEECALLGVSAIVLDPNNDLARLGERWPEAPPDWEDGDERRAGEYLAGTDVVVWTPGRAGGRPLSFQPLPDFTGLAGDPDEFTEAVEAAVAFIVPRIRLDANTNKAHLGQAVLRKALAYHGVRGATSLKGFAALLSDLPDGVSELADAHRIAAELAQSLTAAMDNDPLFGGAGTPVDPGLLVTPPEGKRARVSVISLVGLPSLEQRQSFVSQLQMELFVWFKRHPAQDRPLGALLVMDEAQTFAPAAGTAASTRSTVLLASQARKYGLGLVFATQAPKGLHNHIPGNSATQFFGLLNAPIQISAAREMARSKGGDVPDVSRLSSGEFYVALEGGAFVKTRVPMCLTRHPKSPLTTEEVIEKSRG
ncbi:ATP-binding protein [Nonomuraea insulae]|uniref:Helicase HerA domain-containing protein n=1 Tax=Nonomuraea insulae TaxID=1616787 RepID=A0ABW1CIS6_9ACTN